MFWKNERIIGEVRKSDTKVIQLSACESKSGTFIANLREWYLDTNGEWKPGKGGLTVPYELIDSLVTMLESTKEALEDM